MSLFVNSSMNKNTNTCNNCGKQGHSFHQCKLPITSYGVIVFRSSLDGLQFLMIRRKDSFGYIDFIRGKYSPYNIYQIQNIVNEMSLTEKQRILTEPFEDLWKTYPKRLGKKAALKHFISSVKSEVDLADIKKALANYIASRVGEDPTYIKHGSTWFNNWRDWVDYQPKENNGGNSGIIS